MLFVVSFEDRLFVTALSNGGDIEGFDKILKYETVYESVMDTLRCGKLSKTVVGERPVIEVDTDNPYYQTILSSGDVFDYTPIFTTAEQVLETGTDPEEVFTLLTQALQQYIPDGLDGDGQHLITKDNTVDLINYAKLMRRYNKGELPVQVGIKLPEEFSNIAEEMAMEMVVENRSRLYNDNSINQGKAMENPNDRFYFRIPGPRAIFDSENVAYDFKPPMLALYTKEHMEHVKNYRHAVYDGTLTGNPSMNTVPVSQSEQDMYTALCQLMVDTVRMPKTGFVIADESSSEEDEVTDEKENVNEAKAELPAGKMRSCHDPSVLLDITDDDDYILSNAKLDREVEATMIMWINAIGSLNWAYSGCFPHAVEYSELEIDDHGVVTYSGKPAHKVTNSDSAVTFVESYKIQSAYLQSFFANYKNVQIEAKQRSIMGYINRCYKEFGPKVLAEAIIKLGRWGSRRPSKLHLGESKRYFNFSTGLEDERSGSFESMELQKVDGRDLSLYGAILVNTPYADNSAVTIDSAYRTLTGYPVGVVAMKTYANKDNPEETDNQFVFISLVDLVTIYTTNIEEHKIAGLEMDADGKFTMTDNMVNTVKLNECINLLTNNNTDNAYKAYRSEELDFCLLPASINQSDYSLLQGYNNVRNSHTGGTELVRYSVPHITGISSYLQGKGMSVNEHYGVALSVFLHNIMEDFMAPVLLDLNKQFVDTMRSLSTTSILEAMMVDPEYKEMGEEYTAAVLLSYMINGVAEVCIKEGYVGEVSNYGEQDFIRRYNIEPRKMVVANQPTTPVNNTASTTMDLFAEPNQPQGSTVGNSTPLIKARPSGASTKLLAVKVAADKAIRVGYLDIGQDNDGYFAVVHMQETECVETVSLTKAHIGRMIFDTVLYESDPNKVVKSLFNNNLVNRLYFVDLDAANILNKLLHQ